MQKAVSPLGGSIQSAHPAVFSLSTLPGLTTWRDPTRPVPSGPRRVAAAARPPGAAPAAATALSRDCGATAARAMGSAGISRERQPLSRVLMPPDGGAGSREGAGSLVRGGAFTGGLCRAGSALWGLGGTL